MEVKIDETVFELTNLAILASVSQNTTQSVVWLFLARQYNS
jgi:hypothetical protein